MRLLFVMDPLDRIDVRGDSTYAIMLEACTRGWSCWWCTPRELFADGGRPAARARPVVARAHPPHFEEGPAEDVRLDDLDTAWMRKDPPFDMDYVAAAWLLDLAAIPVFNRPSALLRFNEKLAALRWPELCPPTLVTADIERARAWARAQGGRVVLKPLDAMAGHGVVLTGEGDPNFRALLELLTAQGRRTIVVQRYVPEIREGDKRIVLVDGEPAGALLRVPGADDHRGNMHVGARVEACGLSARDREICAALAPTLREEGLLFVGIDVIGGYLTEINVTSPTGVREIERLTGQRVAARICDAVARRVESVRGGGAG